MDNFAWAMGEMLKRMPLVECVTHGWIEPSIMEHSVSPQERMVLPQCCCSEPAFDVYYAFDAAWNSLPEDKRPLRDVGMSVSLGENPDNSIEDNAKERHEYQQVLLESVIGETCPVHGPQNSLTIEFDHRDDGYSELVLKGSCCELFERAARFCLGKLMMDDAVPDPDWKPGQE